MKVWQRQTFLFSLFLLTTLNLIPLALAPPPSYLTVTTGEIPLGDLTDPDKFIQGAYYIYDRNNPDLLWIGGKRNATDELRILKLNRLSGVSTVIDPGVGNDRNYFMTDDSRNLYCPSSDSGDFYVLDKVGLNGTNYNPFGAGNPISVSANETDSMVYSSSTKIFYVLGGNQVTGKLGYFAPYERKFYNWTYATQGNWAHFAVVVNDMMYFLQKDGAWLGMWNWTSHTYVERQLVTDSNYPTTWVDGTCYDAERNLIWFDYYGGGMLIKFDIATETWQSYDVSTIVGDNLGMFLLGDYVGFYEFGGSANIYLWPPESGPIEYGTERPNVWQYAETISDGEHWSGSCGYNPDTIGVNTLYFVTVNTEPDFWWKYGYVTINPLEYTSIPVDVDSAPSQLGTQLGISSFAAGLVLGVILMAIINIPIMLLVRGKDGAKYVLIIFLFASEGIAVVIGWFPVWLMILTILGVAGLWALTAKGYF